MLQARESLVMCSKSSPAVAGEGGPFEARWRGYLGRRTPPPPCGRSPSPRTRGRMFFAAIAWYSRSLRPCADIIAQHADPLDLDLAHIPVLHPGHARRGAAGDDV